MKKGIKVLVYMAIMVVGFYLAIHQITDDPVSFLYANF